MNWVFYKFFRLVSNETPSLSGSEAYWDAERKNWNFERLSSRNWCAGGQGGGALHVSMRMHQFPCECIPKVGVHYHHNGLAAGCSCLTRPLAFVDHSRQPCSEGGQGRVTGRVRTAGGCMSGWLDHTGTFQITISICICCNDVIIASKHPRWSMNM